jgi:hypothetical protein
MKMTTEQMVPEEMACERLGVTREKMRELRLQHMAEGRDWLKEKNRVWITAAALNHLLGLLGADGSTEWPGSQSPKKTGRSWHCSITRRRFEEVEGIHVLRVVRIPSRNTRILEASQGDGSSPIVRVLVRTNRHFVPGMLLAASPGGQWADVFVLHGRSPRWSGRW